MSETNRQIALQAFNGQYVCAEDGGGGRSRPGNHLGNLYFDRSLKCDRPVI